MLLVYGVAALPQKFKVKKNAATRHVARNVTGLPILASIWDSLYFETGWESAYG